MRRQMHACRPTRANTRRSRGEQVHRRRFVLIVSSLALMVMITAVIEASSISQAAKGEVPDKMLAKFPPPDSVNLKQE